MERGARKQLDFEDLLQLPFDMDPLSCHDILLSCWKKQQKHDHSHPSLFRAICCAYGWPYMRLGLLKVKLFVSHKAFLFLYCKREELKEGNTKE